MIAPTKPKLPLREAQWLAYELVHWLRPGCRQIAVAGSIRRQKPLVGDVEIVAEPILTVSTNLFGEETGHTSALDLIVERHIAAGHWEFDTRVKRNGPRYKRLRVPSMDTCVDLFIVNSRNWGNQLALRTGDADFARLVFTRREQGGVLPNNYRHHDGYLYTREVDEPQDAACLLQAASWRDRRGRQVGEEEPVPCPTEEAFFARLIGPGFVPHPTWRDAETAALLRRLTIEELQATGRDAPR